jgi:hydrogenase nickel incorporation protein HypA/HybF
MHELPISQNILDIALRHASQAGATKIVTIHITIGQLSSVVDDSVAFYWEMIAQGTPAENARLEFKRIPARLRCLDCQHEYTYDGDDFTCPACKSSQVQVIAGREFYVESLDVV